MKIAVDFDGTIVEHCFPEIGPPVPGAVEWLQKFAAAGAELILWTVRGGIYLGEARRYCDATGLRFAGFNVSPGQAGWSESPKAYAAIYIDDAAFGCPLIPSTTGRPMVDWSKVGPAILHRLIERDDVGMLCR